MPRRHLLLLVFAWLLTIIAVNIRGQSQATPQGGVMRGRVVDDGGRPLVAGRVSIGSLVVSDTEARLIALPISVRTDDRGAFEAIGIPPGDWYVRVEQDALVPRALGDDTPDYPATYFPGVSDPAQAKPVRVASDGATDDVVIVVRGIPVFDMALRLAPLDALKSANLELFLNGEEAGRPRAIAPREAEPDGLVRFRRLRPGRYFVWARARVGDRTLVAWRRVDIRDRSEAIDFTLVPAGRVSGRVIGADAGVLSGARVVATLVDEGRTIDYREPDSAEVLAEGRFAIDGVFGQRRLRVIGLPDGWRTASIRVGGQETSDAILVAEGAAIDGIEITLTR